MPKETVADKYKRLSMERGDLVQKVLNSKYDDTGLHGIVTPWTIDNVDESMFNGIPYGSYPLDYRTIAIDIIKDDIYNGTHLYKFVPIDWKHQLAKAIKEFNKVVCELEEIDDELKLLAYDIPEHMWNNI